MPKDPSAITVSQPVRRVEKPDFAIAPATAIAEPRHRKLESYDPSSCILPLECKEKES